MVKTPQCITMETLLCLHGNALESVVLNPKWEETNIQTGNKGDN